MKRLVVIVIACGGSNAPQPASSRAPASLTATRTNSADVQVASVNGRPVWGSCMTAQSGRGLDRKQALAQCIDFELLAQTAEARGYALDRDVAAETHAAMVSQFVAHEFEGKFTKPAEFGDYWPRIIERNRGRHDHPEVRGSAYVRVQDEALARQIAAALANERGLMPAHIREIAERVVGGRGKLDFAVVPPDVRNGRLDETYTSALFAIAQVGSVSPPVHTQWGWDIILFESVIPAASPTADELAAKLLPDVKRSYFPQWVNKLAQSAGVNIQVLEANVPLLENL